MEETYLKKQLFWQRVCAFACLGILLVVAVSAALLIPQVNQTLTMLDTTLSSLDALTAQLNTVDWAAMAQSIHTLTDTAQTSLATLDVEGLNKAIADLQAAVAPLANLAQMLR